MAATGDIKATCATAGCAPLRTPESGGGDIFADAGGVITGMLQRHKTNSSGGAETPLCCCCGIFCIRSKFSPRLLLATLFSGDTHQSRVPYSVVPAARRLASTRAAQNAVAHARCAARGWQQNVTVYHGILRQRRRRTVLS
jgi:hypothetical protein